MDANSTIKSVKDRLDRMYSYVNLIFSEEERAKLIEENKILKKQIDNEKEGLVN
jgi:hypothetical protein